MRIRTMGAFLAAALVGWGGMAAAEFPERNIESFFPWGPGATMGVSQIIADAMGDELRVNISVISTPGATGTKAFLTAMGKPADGYTLTGPRKDTSASTAPERVS